MNNKKVYIAYTGGTIGMTATEHGYAPAPGYLGKLLAEQPEFNSANMPDVVFKEYENIIDSSNATPWHWNKIAEDIAENYDDFDGFVILHGTDTMAYSACALSFQLGNLNKPVILTGSQIPFAEIRSDARENLIGAVQLATKPKLSEVSVYFHNELYRGNRTTKTDSSGFAAFESPNYPTLARVGIEIDINKRYLLDKNDDSDGLEIIYFQNNPEVGTLQIFPGITGRLLHNYLQQPVKGLVLMTYGSGNIPNHDQMLVDEITSACERGVIIVNCTQCLRGTVNMKTYQTGSKLEQAGVVNAHDMTIEATVTKLTWLLGIYPDDPDKVRQLMAQDLRGEITL